MQRLAAMLERAAKGHGGVKLLKLGFQLFVDQQQRPQRAMQVAIAACHNPVDGFFARPGTHRNTLWLSPEQNPWRPARVPVDCVDRSQR